MFKKRYFVKLEVLCIELIDARKVYTMKDGNVIALDNLNIKFKKGKFYAIMGHSGSGKTTLIQILGLLDELTEGKYYIDGTDTSTLTENDKSYLRMKKIGFIYQSFHLIDNLKAFENVMLPMIINHDIPKEERKEKAVRLLEIFNLSERVNHFPKQLSGGEQQRVAIARALANEPDIILADEPTGNLDSENEKVIFQFLKKISELGKCVIVVSHSDVIKEYADIVYTMSMGKIKGDSNELS